MQEAIDAYWRKNIRLKAILLAIWAFVSLGLAIILVEPLNNVEIGGFPLGFWMAQQGAIITFVVLIFVYAKLMDGNDSQLEAELKETGEER
jgi:putative solute:sodium symporter small subunit